MIRSSPTTTSSLIVVSVTGEEVTFRYNCVCESREENLIKSFMRIKFAESDKFPKNNVERRPNRSHNAVNTRHQNDKYLTWRRIEGITNWSNREIFFFFFLFFYMIWYPLGGTVEIDKWIPFRTSWISLISNDCWKISSDKFIYKFCHNYSIKNINMVLKWRNLILARYRKNTVRNYWS